MQEINLLTQLKEAILILWAPCLKKIYTLKLSVCLKLIKNDN